MRGMMPCASVTVSPSRFMPVSIWIAAHGLAVDAGIGFAGILEETVERVDRGRRQRGAEQARFTQGSDEKGLAAGTRQRAGDRFGAAAISVRLDHAGAFGRHRRLL